MAKEPRTGSTKTRLSPPLSSEQAADLYEAMLLDTLDLCVSLDDIDLAIAITPAESRTYFERISPPSALLLPVDCENIGACLQLSLSDLLDRGYKKALALNSDGPSLPPTYIRRAVQMLDERPLVYGPSEDGGYYLIGLKRFYPELFTGIEWSTPRVMTQSLEKARQLTLDAGLLPPWYDIDTSAELARLQADAAAAPEGAMEHSRRYFAENPV